MYLKRTVDVVLSCLGLVVLFPILSLIAFAVCLDSPGPIFFRQERVGRYGRVFRIHKFRTMEFEPDISGLLVTVGNDSRITKIGRFLRRYKLDELPQLIDVFIGKMSLVGPRPEVPKYVSYYPLEFRELILSVRPGITDNAAIYYRSESLMLSGAENPERFYIESILPQKVSLYVAYVSKITLRNDLLILLRTLVALWT
jgi:lipopolysaccharide/colanic/teichoic acid biosynthesis glycosyltransferase